jgi:hypothetical protein
VGEVGFLFALLVGHGLLALALALLLGWAEAALGLVALRADLGDGDKVLGGDEGDEDAVGGGGALLQLVEEPEIDVGDRGEKVEVEAVLGELDAQGALVLRPCMIEG